ncbi:MAG: winged helix-turn-helix transcriptional regulator [FCB group bacterium]|nr:winged helix-turn-helix transcriptional regulator [FCB group bacterium]
MPETGMCACETVFVDEEKVRTVQENISPDETLHILANTFKLLGEPTRLKILLALSIEELCVCDIASLLGITRSAISHQLRLLKSSRLVKFRRAGKMVYYSLDDQHVKHLLKDGLEHLND